MDRNHNMADFKEDTKQNLKEGLRERVENSTGIVGEALRKRREQKEQEKQTQSEVAAVEKVTAKMKMGGTTLTNMEKSFTQMSENLQLIAKAFKAQATTFEETQAAYQPQQAPQQRNQAPAAIEAIKKDSEEISLFDKVSGLIDGFDKARKAYRAVKAAARVVKGAAKGIAKGAAKAIGKAGAKEVAKKASEAAIKTSARKILAKSLGKLVGKSIPIAGAAVGIGFAVSKMLDGDWVGAGVEAVSGLGSAVTAIPATIYSAAREVYFDVYGMWPESDPNKEERFNDLYSVVKSMAADLLKDNVKANESDAKSARLKRQAVPVKAPTAAAGPAALPPTGAGGGRGGAGGPSAAEAIKATLTSSQLAWLGDADPTDPYIMARMPAPEAPPVSAAVPPPPPPARPAPKPAAPAPALTPPQPVSIPSVAAVPIKPAPAGPAQQIPGGIVGIVMDSLKGAGIASEKAIANILATIKAESGFRPRSEELNYSSAEKIQKTFGVGRVPTLEFAQQFVGNPEALANEMYKKTDGNKEPGDGWKYRGRGFIQHTGRNQYEGIKKFTGVDVVSNPDLLNDPVLAAKAVAYFFLSYKKKKPEQLENISEVNKAVGFADDKAGTHAAERAQSASQINASLSSGQNMESLSTSVASAKKSKQTGSSVTVIAVNNNTQTKVGATNRPPQSQTTAVVGA